MENGGGPPPSTQKIWAGIAATKNHPISHPHFPWPCGHWQSQTYTKLPPVPSHRNRKGVRNPRFNRFWVRWLHPRNWGMEWRPPKPWRFWIVQMRNSGVQFGVSGFWGNLSRQCFVGVNVPPRILRGMVGLRYTPSLSSWTLLEDWVMIWFPRTVLSESWLHRKKAGPRPQKNLQRVLLVVLGFIPGTLKHQNIVKTSSSSSSSPFTVATYRQPHYLHPKPQTKPTTTHQPPINSYSTLKGPSCHLLGETYLPRFVQSSRRSHRHSWHPRRRSPAVSESFFGGWRCGGLSIVYVTKKYGANVWKCICIQKKYGENVSRY